MRQVEATNARSEAIDVIIPTKNRSHDLDRCLSALHPQLRNGDRIVVIDNGSNDGTSTTLSKFPGVTVIQDPTPNLARLFNVGLRSGSTPIVGFLNDDSEPSANWLDSIRYWFSTLDDAAAIGGLTQDVRARTIQRYAADRSLYFRLYDLFLMDGHGRSAGVLTPWGTFSVGLPPADRPVRATGLTITNLAIRREVFSVTGEFDEDLKWAHIDGLLFLEMQAHHMSMYLVPGMNVKHYVNPTGSTRSAYWLSRDQAVFFAKISEMRSAPRSRVMLAKAASVGYWITSAKSPKPQYLVQALKGYASGRAYVRARPRSGTRRG